MNRTKLVLVSPAVYSDRKNVRVWVKDSFATAEEEKKALAKWEVEICAR